MQIIISFLGHFFADTCIQSAQVNSAFLLKEGSICRVTDDVFVLSTHAKKHGI